MLELTWWTRTKYLYKLTNSIRQSSTKATIKIRLNKENKAIFGPVIKNEKKKGKQFDKLVKNKIASEDCGELSWSIATGKIDSFMIVKKINDTDNCLKKNSTYKFLKLQDESVDKKILQIKSSKTKKNPDNLGSKAVKKIDYNLEKEEDKNFDDNVQNLLSEEKIKKPDNDVNKKVGDLLRLKSNEILNFSIFGKTKDKSDNWQSKDIQKFTAKSQYDYSLPGVTRVLNETMSEQAKLMLEKWREKMIKELGEDGFNLYYQAQLQDSKTMHSLIEKTLRKEPVDVPSHIKPSYESINLILKDINNVRFIESQIVHPELGYRGFADCIASYGGKVCLIDWKKSEKAKTLNTTYDSPLQISAYIGALNADPNYPFQVKTGLLAIAYSNGNPPSVFEFSTSKLEFYWKEWLKRLDKYHTMHSNYS